MKMRSLIFLIYFIVNTVIFASGSDSVNVIDETGYIRPTCDSLGIALFVDGVMIGYSPIRHLSLIHI